MAMIPVIEVENVNKHYGDFHALKHIDMSVNKGEVVVVIGPSGSGKSTLCRSINRLETITDGEIRIDGKVLPKEGKALAKLRADVGMVFQSFNLFAHKTILENVTIGPSRRCPARRQRPTPDVCSTGSVSVTRQKSIRHSSPVVSSSALRLPGPSL